MVRSQPAEEGFGVEGDDRKWDGKVLKEEAEVQGAFIDAGNPPMENSKRDIH
jgi:hypothetical protein